MDTHLLQAEIDQINTSNILQFDLIDSTFFFFAPPYRYSTQSNQKSGCP